MTNYTIGIERGDGDFQVLATLNNNEEVFTPEQFEALKESLLVQMYDKLGLDELIVCLERQDAPDYVSLEGAEVEA